MSVTVDEYSSLISVLCLLLIYFVYYARNFAPSRNKDKPSVIQHRPQSSTTPNVQTGLNILLVKNILKFLFIRGYVQEITV